MGGGVGRRRRDGEEERECIETLIISTSAEPHQDVFFPPHPSLCLLLFFSLKLVLKGNQVQLLYGSTFASYLHGVSALILAPLVVHAVRIFACVHMTGCSAAS